MVGYKMGEVDWLNVDIICVEINPPLPLDKVLSILSKMGVKAVILRPEAVAGYSHVKIAIQNSLIAHREGINIAKTLPLEIVCNVAGTRQIGKALEKVAPSQVGRALLIIPNDGGKRVSIPGAQVFNCLPKGEDELKEVIKFHKIPLDTLETTQGKTLEEKITKVLAMRMVGLYLR